MEGCVCVCVCACVCARARVRARVHVCKIMIDSCCTAETSNFVYNFTQNCKAIFPQLKNVYQKKSDCFIKVSILHI